MFLYLSTQEALVLLQASDEDYAEYAGLVCSAAAGRDEDKPDNSTS